MPEEINRILTDHVSDLLFTPTLTARKNLKNEGIDDNKIFNVGDVMYDATTFYAAKAERQSSLLSDLNLSEKKFILATIHRAENTDSLDKLMQIVDSLEEVATMHNLVWPIHPRTKKSLEQIDFSTNTSKIQFIEPVGYLDMMMLEKYAKTIITDSGGVQKEAYFHKVPCITLRDETEWVELVEQGYNLLANSGNLLEVLEGVKIIEFLGTDNLYGNGDAAHKIVKELLRY